MNNALDALGIDVRPPARRQPAQPSAGGETGSERQLRRIFVVLALALAVYVGQLVLAEWRYQEARRELTKAVKSVLPGR